MKRRVWGIVPLLSSTKRFGVGVGAECCRRRLLATRPHPPPPINRQRPKGVREVVAVASGKGGVGKSTTAVNLALALSSLGRRVGLLDADIYGPSIPRMLHLHDPPRRPAVEGGLLLPITAYGLQCMSMGFLVEEDAPMIWRGPMVMSALEQLFYKVAWGELDILVVDLPPGTGDAQLTLTQRVLVSGAIVVSTPQDIALIDARRGANMFKKVDVPILGIIENMSYFACPKCGEVSHIFGHHGARQTAQQMGLDFLGEVPLHIDIRETSDAGRPIVISQADSSSAKAYAAIAQKVVAKLEDPNFQGPQTPKIIIQ
jgi:ATP-binding protein involved in chromosome partitioning